MFCRGIPEPEKPKSLCSTGLLWEGHVAQRYHFDLNNGHDLIRDDKGVEAHDLDQAIKEAQAVLEEMRRSKKLLASDKGWRLVIRDESGASLMMLPLA